MKPREGITLHLDDTWPIFLNGAGHCQGTQNGETLVCSECGAVLREVNDSWIEVTPGNGMCQITGVTWAWNPTSRKVVY